jgi:hypothetical protein
MGRIDGSKLMVNELECDGLWFLIAEITRVKNELFSAGIGT